MLGQESVEIGIVGVDMIGGKLAGAKGFLGQNGQGQQGDVELDAVDAPLVGQADVVLLGHEGPAAVLDDRPGTVSAFCQQREHLPGKGGLVVQKHGAAVLDQSQGVRPGDEKRSFFLIDVSFYFSSSFTWLSPGE